MTYQAKRLSLSIVIICFIAVGLQTVTPVNQVNAFSPQVIQQGSTGDDVIELQARLQYLGFYNGDIDGVFGWGTYWALRNFQYEFGLEVDGLAGSATKNKLVQESKYDKQYVKSQIRSGNEFTYYGGVSQEKQSASQNNETAPPGNETAPQRKGTANQGNNQENKRGNKQAGNQTKPKPTAVNVPQGYSQNDIHLMASAVHGEARGEPYVGQVAVAAVILNRVESSSFPNTISGVIFEPRAFTAVSDGQIWLQPSKTSIQAVKHAINGWDPSGGALYYFNPKTATSEWIWSRPQIKKIGKHIFCK